MWLAGCCTTLLLSARRAFGSQIFVQASASGGPARLQRALDAVDPSGPPQVHLTFPSQLAGSQGGRSELASLMVLDSSFNPPTRAHMHLLTSSMQRFGCAAAAAKLPRQAVGRARVTTTAASPAHYSLHGVRRTARALLLLAKQNADKAVVGCRGCTCTSHAHATRTPRTRHAHATRTPCTPLPGGRESCAAAADDGAACW